MKSKATAASLLLGTFLMGAVAGGIAYSLYINLGAAESRKAFGQRGGPHNVVKELAEGLKLDDEQTQKLKVIFKESREQFKELSLQFRPQYSSIRNETNQKIRKILRNDQKARFEEIIRDLSYDHRNRDRGHRYSKQESSSSTQ